LLLLLTAFVAAVRLLPIWLVATLIVVLVFGVPALIRLVIGLYIRKVSRELAGILRGATVDVASVVPIEPPDPSQLDDDDDDEEDEQEEDSESDATADDVNEKYADEPPSARCWYEIKLGITPQDSSAESGSWDPRSLFFVPAGTPREEISADCRVGRVEREENGLFVALGDRVCYQAERLRMLVGVVPGTLRVQLRYMLIESLGDAIELPPHFKTPLITQQS
jgi:hypothetical protein